MKGGIWDMSDRKVDALQWPSSPQPQISTVYFRRNGLTQIPITALAAAFPQLQELSFRENRLEGIDEATLHLWAVWQGSCQKLSLSQNRISRLPAALFDHVGRALTVLTLANNRFEALPESIGYACPALLALDVSGNLLRSLPDSLAQCTQLTLLNAQQNQLTALPVTLATAAAALMKLKVLQLSHNQLETLWPTARMVPLPALEELHLSNNRLKKVPLWLTTSAPRLKQLDLHMNQLVCFPDKRPLACFAQLQRLNLAINQLKSVPSTITSHLVALEWLNMNDNALQRLPENWRHLSKLKKLGLVQNALRSLPAALADLPALARLDVRRNQLTHLPQALRKLRRPDTTLLINGNPLWDFDGDVALHQPKTANRWHVQTALPSLQYWAMAAVAKGQFELTQLPPLLQRQMQPDDRRTCAHCKSTFFGAPAAFVKRQEWMSQDPDAAPGEPSVLTIRIPFLHLLCRSNCMTRPVASPPTASQTEKSERGRDLQRTGARARSRSSATTRVPVGGHTMTDALLTTPASAATTLQRAALTTAQYTVSSARARPLLLPMASPWRPLSSSTTSRAEPAVPATPSSST